MIFGWPLWVIALMVWCELSGDEDDSDSVSAQDEQ